jgi:hypothetical protein
MREQYLKAIDIFDSENSRFWTRFNLFTGMQLVVVAGVAANLKELLDYLPIAILLLAMAFAFSLFTVAIVYRSRQISLGIYQTLLALEQRDPDCDLVGTYMKHTRSPMGSIAKYCVFMAGLLSIFWVCLAVALLLSR